MSMLAFLWGGFLFCGAARGLQQSTEILLNWETSVLKAETMSRALQREKAQMGRVTDSSCFSLLGLVQPGSILMNGSSFLIVMGTGSRGVGDLSIYR